VSVKHSSAAHLPRKQWVCVVKEPSSEAQSLSLVQAGPVSASAWPQALPAEHVGAWARWVLGAARSLAGEFAPRQAASELASRGLPGGPDPAALPLVAMPLIPAAVPLVAVPLLVPLEPVDPDALPVAPVPPLAPELDPLPLPELPLAAGAAPSDWLSEELLTAPEQAAKSTSEAAVKDQRFGFTQDRSASPMPRTRRRNRWDERPPTLTRRSTVAQRDSPSVRAARASCSGRARGAGPR
jgi:hypothetical protein